MKTTLVLLFFISLASAQYFAQAIIKGTAIDPNITGTVTFSQPLGQNVTVSVNITGITNGTDILHGIHVHMYGDMSDQAAALAVGSHFNGSTGGAHGCPEVSGTNRHFGDMGNWQATAGSIVFSKTLDLLTLNGLDSIIGRAVILHSKNDDCTTPGTGDSGVRLAQGVVGIVNSTKFGGSVDASQGFPNVTNAICVLSPASGSVTGTVWFSQEGSGQVNVFAIINGITGPHGFHVHQYGDVSDPAGLATASHWNPLGSVHGVPPFSVRHAGDMGIINHYQNNIAYYNYTNDYLTLKGANSIIGRAVHVHSNTDDCTNPVGNGGARLAQCVIGVSGTPTIAFPPLAVPSVQDGNQICNALSSVVTVSHTSAASVTSDFSVPSTNTRTQNTNKDSPASMITFAWTVFVFAFAFCF
jgi:Cu-Zn family superoxide dismutase